MKGRMTGSLPKFTHQTGLDQGKSKIQELQVLAKRTEEGEDKFKHMEKHEPE